LIRSGERGSRPKAAHLSTDLLSARRPRQDSGQLGQCIRLGKTVLECPAARAARCLRTKSPSAPPPGQPRTGATDARHRRGRTGRTTLKNVSCSLSSRCQEPRARRPAKVQTNKCKRIECHRSPRPRAASGSASKSRSSSEHRER
jgi:hypothetical protein